MTFGQRSWLLDVAAEATVAQHVFPKMAACEAALESNYGQSALARQANNLFGLKQRAHPLYGTLNLPTKEFEGGSWVSTEAAWVRYDNLQECFADRMVTLQRLANVYPEYEAALTAPDAQTYIVSVSKRWSTDPLRASKVLAIYNDAFPPDPPATPPLSLLDSAE